MQLNNAQKTTAIFSLIGNMAMGILPPWETSVIRGGVLTPFNSGYHPIWAPPQITSSINSTTLTVQVLSFSAFCLIVFLLFGMKKETKPATGKDEPKDTPTCKLNTKREEAAVTAKKAGPWVRLLARLLDMAMATQLTILIFFSAMFFLSPDSLTPFRLKMIDIKMSLLFGWAAYTASFLIDAIIYSIAKNTIWKLVFNIKASKKDGTRLSFTEYTRRNYEVYAAGLAFGLPIINLATMAMQFFLLKNEKQTSYDKLTASSVFKSGQKKWQRIVLILMVPIFLLAIASISDINAMLIYGPKR